MENPTLQVLEGIAAALGVEIEALFAQPQPGEEAPGPLPGGRKRRKAI
jgi:transcriptional regulator with XRE-family HTH domain